MYNGYTWMFLQPVSYCTRLSSQGTFAVTQAICQALVAAKISGSIVNIASVIGQTGNMGQSNYAASKAAVEAFTKTVAKEMGL